MKLAASSSMLFWSVLLALGLMSCRGKEATAPTETTAIAPTAQPPEDTSAEGSTDTDAAATARPASNGSDTGQTTPDFPQLGKLTAQEADAQINLRSQPSTTSPDQGYGVVGDAVKLLKSAAGEDGFTWYYVQFEDSGAEGWIRGDFVAPATGSAAIPQAAAGASSTSESKVAEVLDSVCGSPDQLNAYYNTPKYNIYVCNSPNGYIYVGNEKGTDNTLVTESVTATEDGFVANNEGYSYTVDSQALRVFEENNTEPLLVETVEFSQRY